MPDDVSNASQTSAPAVPSRLPVAVDIDNPIALYLDTGVFEQIQRVAKLMVSSGLAPAHLRGPEKMADAFLVVAQAFRWRMDPFAVAQHTYVYQGKLGYEGKLIAGVVNSNRRIENHLSYRYEESGDKRRIIVSGKLKGEKEPREIEGSLAGWRTGNEKWKTMTDQMLAYRGAREWARRHMPEAVLGIVADDELAAVGPERARDVTPKPTVDASVADAFERASAGVTDVVEEPPADPDWPPTDATEIEVPIAEPPDPKSAGELAAYAVALLAWIPRAAQADLDAHFARNKRMLDYLRVNREGDQQKIDLALDGRRQGEGA